MLKSKAKISVPFLASQFDQFPDKIKCEATEAIIFNRSDLENENWLVIWDNVQRAVNLIGASNITFHFPVNNSDYIEDNFVFQRLEEAMVRASDLNLHGVVVHSNRIRLIEEWQKINLEDERRKVAECLENIRQKIKSDTWLALENMPVMDNYGIEIDPLFCYPDDFKILSFTNIGIVWDICHYTNTVATIKEVLDGRQNPKYYPNIKETTYFDFLSLNGKILHWHFSAFRGISNPENGDVCVEGVLPFNSTIEENIYRKIINQINQYNNAKRYMVLEIKEIDYKKRINTLNMINWINKN